MDLKHLPQGWSVTDIESILSAQSDGKLIHQGWSPQCERVPAGDDEWGVLKTTAIQDGYFLENENKRLPLDKEPKQRIEVQAGDLLITNAGPRSRCGVICYVNETRDKLMLSGKMYRLRFPEMFVSAKYIELWLRTSFTQKELNDRKTGISESGLNMTQARFRTLPIVFAPLAEQKIIAQKLDTLLAQVENTKARLERTRETMKRFRQSVLAAAVSGKLTEEWRDSKTLSTTGLQLLDNVLQQRENSWSLKGKYKEPEGLSSSLKLNLPDTWTEASLDSLIDCNRPICYGILMPKDNVEDGVLYVKVRDMKGNRINLDGLQRTSHEIAGKYSRSSLVEGDLLLSIRGTYGRLATIPKQLDGGNITQDSARIAVSSLVNSDFIKHTIRSQHVQSYFKLKARGVAVKGVNIGDVRPTPIPLPSLEEQTEIVRQVKQLFAHADTIDKQVEAAQARVNNLTQSILAKAFRGELTEQWRKDNPELISGENSAEALLEKIKSERAIIASTKTKTRRKPKARAETKA